MCFNPKCRAPAHWAAREGHIEMLKYLDTIGTNMDILDDKGDSLLHKAAANGQLGSVKWLLQHGLNVQLANNNVSLFLTYNNQRFLKLNRVLPPCN